MSFFRFEIIHQSTKSRARVGRIHTPHGIIDTPNFVAVGTNGTLKTIDNCTVTELGLQLMFCNTYHLIIHPGPETIALAGGLHKFINRPLPLITDSGGFQVFSLAYGTVKDELKSKGLKKNNPAVLKVTEEGVLFRSYRDGSPLLLTPETSIQAQKAFGADIIIPLDELPPYHIHDLDLSKSLDRTHRWQERSLNEHLKDRKEQAMYAVIHGGINHELRSKSSNLLSQLSFDGFAIGGSLGKNREEMVTMLTTLMPQIPGDKPNHLLGIGDLPSLPQCIALGIDTFDSSHPTRCARHGILFADKESVNITKSCYKNLFSSPIDGCICYTCTHYSAAYIHHLFKAHEPTALTLATIHNLHFMINLMSHYRQNILDGNI